MARFESDTQPSLPMSTQLGVGFALLAALALAVQSVSVQRSTTHQPLSDVITVVFLVNLLVMVPVTVGLFFPAFDLTLLSIGAFATGGILGSLLARIALFVGIVRLGASRAEPLKSTFPLVAVLIAVVALGEALTATVVAGVLLVVIGGAAVSWDAQAVQTGGTRQRRWVDVGFPLAAALLLGVDPVFTKIGLETGTSPIVATTVRVIAAAAVFACYRLWKRFRARTPGRLLVTRWSFTAGIANTVYLLAYLAALGRAPVSLVTPILGVSPLLVLAISPFVSAREERITIRLGIAVTILVAGVVLVLSG